MHCTHVVGIDPSLRQTGMALIPFYTETPKVWSFGEDVAAKTSLERQLFMVERVQLLPTGDVLCGVEVPPAPFAQTAGLFVERQQLIGMFLYELSRLYGITRVVQVAPSTLRKFYGVKAKKSADKKKQMLSEAQRRHPALRIHNGDEADAVAIADLLRECLCPKGPSVLDFPAIETVDTVRKNNPLVFK